MHGALVFALLLACIASHLTIVVSLALRPPRMRSVYALLLPPMAPYFAWTALMPRRTLAWLIATVLYAASVAAA